MTRVQSIQIPIIVNIYSGKKISELHSKLKSPALENI